VRTLGRRDENVSRTAGVGHGRQLCFWFLCMIFAATSLHLIRSSFKVSRTSLSSSMSHAKPFTDSVEVFNQPLKQGVKIPRIGLGVFQSAPGTETEEAVACALQEGYRHIDTAALYRNEASVGELKASLLCLE
jgi:hypothetical protein